MTKRLGFTVIEFVTALALAGALGAIFWPLYQHVRARARIVGTMNQLLGIRAIVMGERPAKDKTLVELTDEACLYCAQGVLPPVDLALATPAWGESVRHDWEAFGYGEQPLDLWRRPLMADANEMELGPDDCRHDAVWSAGADGRWDGVGPTGDAARGDDLVVTIPFFRQTSRRCPEN